jgi:hypothetical protein
MRLQLVLYCVSVFTLLVLPSESALSSGCGKSLPNGFSPGQTTSVEISATNGQPVRHYKVHLSTNFENNQGHAIVFSFHGRGREMSYQEDLSQLSQEGLLINGAEIIAIYPRGKDGTTGGPAWQGAPYSTPGVDDVSLFRFSFISIDNKLII